MSVSALAVAGAADELRKVAIGVRPDDQVDLRDALEQHGAETLRHAADHAEHVPGTLVALQLAHPADDPLLGVVAHCAGVHQHHVGLGRVLRAHVALAAEDAEHELGVRHVHLAAVGFDVDAFHGVTDWGYCLHWGHGSAVPAGQRWAGVGVHGSGGAGARAGRRRPPSGIRLGRDHPA